jgi:hypothetical protein
MLLQGTFRILLLYDVADSINLDHSKTIFQIQAPRTPARLYRRAAAKVGVPDYRRLADEKLRTAGELYQFMVDQFEHARSFVLELSIVIILNIDLIFLFKGK